MHRTALLALALLASACAPDATAVLVEVTSSDLAVPADVDGLRFEAVSQYGSRTDRTFPIDGAWPHSLTIVPLERERAGTLRVTVTATRGGSFVVRRVVETSFEEGTTRRVLVELPGSCRNVMCAPEVDCRAGVCAGIESDAGVDASLPDAGPLDAGEELDAGGEDGGITIDAGDGGAITLDSGTPDAGIDSGTPDAGIDAGTRDSGTDAGPRDAGIDAPPASDAGGVYVCAVGTCAGRVLISEVSPRNGSAGSDEFVEIYNPGTVPVDIGGVELRYVSSTGTTDTTRGMFPAGTVVAPHGYFLAVSSGYTGSPAGDPGLTPWTSGMADAGSVYLRIGGSSGTVIDLVAWGGAARSEGAPFPTASSMGGAQSFERKANAASTAASMSTGGADVGAGNAYDSGDNASDFVARTARDPQSRASAPEP